MTKPPPLLAPQPSAVASLLLDQGPKTSCWRYLVQNQAGRWSERFKTREAAIAAALSRGFAAVTFAGRVVARRAAS